MLSNLLTLVLLMTFIACNKEYKKSDNGNVETVDALNRGSYETVIRKSANKKNLTPRERYYLASAYSSSANVDVYSLYPVMEIQLFHKNALEWSDLSKEKNPYLKFLKNQEGIDYENRNKKREDRWKKYLPQIMKKHGILEAKPSLMDIKNDPEYPNPDATLEEYNLADAHYKALAEKFPTQDHTVDTFNNAWYEAVDKENEEKKFDQTNTSYFLKDYYEGNILLSLLKKQYLNPDQNQPLTGNIQWEMLYMNILWNTYEAIPIMKKMPKLSSEQQQQVTLALNEYLILLKDKEFKDVSLKNILILSGVSLLSIYSNSFDLEEVDSIQDLYCSFEPNILLDNYTLIRKRILFLEEAYKHSGLNAEEYEKYKAHIEAYKNSVPEEITVEQRNHFVEGVDKFKVDSCFNG